jgi:uncharacterized protein
MEVRPGGGLIARFAASPILSLQVPDEPRFEAHLANGFRKRLLGLAWLDRPPRSRGLLIPCCTSIHTFGMRFSIDVAFIAWPPDAGLDGRVPVLAVRERVPPRRLARLPFRSRPAPRRSIGALELPAGRAARLGIRGGGRLSLARTAPRR